MSLRGTSKWMACNCCRKWVEWGGGVGAAIGYLALAFMHNGLMGREIKQKYLWKFEYHKSPLCKVASGGGGGTFFGAPWCICFFCKYRDKKCTPGAIRQWMRGGWLVSWYVRLNFNTNWYWMKLSFCGIYKAYTKYSCHKWAILSLFWVIIAIFFMGWKVLTLQKLILKSMVEEKMINHYMRRQILIPEGIV